MRAISSVRQKPGGVDRVPLVGGAQGVVEHDLARQRTYRGALVGREAPGQQPPGPIVRRVVGRRRRQRGAAAGAAAAGGAADSAATSKSGCDSTGSELSSGGASSHNGESSTAGASSTSVTSSGMLGASASAASSRFARSIFSTAGCGVLPAEWAWPLAASQQLEQGFAVLSRPSRGRCL